MNFLILGGNGYLGSKVVKKLLEEGNKVVATKREKSDLFRLEDCREEMTFIPASIEAIEVVLDYVKFDWVINMACNYGRSDVLYDNVIESNIEFPLKVLNTTVRKGILNYMTIGTGLPSELNMYSFSKNMFSKFGEFYVKKHDINFYNMKLEMFYGSDEPQNRFIPNLILQMLKGEEVKVTLGTQHRDVISIDDVVRAIFLMLNSDWKGYYEIPIGTGEAPTISEIVDYIWEKTGRKSIVRKGAVKIRADEPDCAADISLISRLGWNPVEWKAGIGKMIEEIKERKDLVK